MKKTASAMKQEKRVRRHRRIRAKVSGTAECPRLTVFRSNTAVYAQLIDDEAGKTLLASDTRSVSGTGKRERARAVGGKVAELAQKSGIAKVVFDRGGFLYIGVIKEVAEGARAGGLRF
jgi:large subunit ribosomal protein L18